MNQLSACYAEWFEAGVGYEQGLDGAPPWAGQHPAETRGRFFQVARVVAWYDGVACPAHGERRSVRPGRAL